MRSGIPRLFPLLCTTILVSGCQADRPLAASVDHASLAASGPGGLGAPSNLTSTAVSPTQINLTWADNSDNETGFEVQRSTTGPAGAFTTVARTGANVASYSDTGLTPLTQYCYRVRAFRVTGGSTKYSSVSNTSCATTPAPPAAPADLRATAVSAIRIDLAWTDNATDETGFNIERCQGEGCTSFVEVAQVDANTVTWVNEGLSASTSYSYRVRARNGTAFSEYSNTATATTLAPPPLHVRAVTTGADLDADGYVVDVWKVDCHPSCGGVSEFVRSVSVPTNGTVTLSDLAVAKYELILLGDAPNCYLTGPGKQTAVNNVEVTVEFTLSCGPGLPIAYTGTADGNAEIYTTSSTGTGSPTRLTFHPASDMEPAWSPDGSKIAFVSDRDGQAEIYVMNAGGSNPVRLTDHPGWDTEPAWSPDGAKIAFVRDGAIYVMNADGSQPTPTNRNGYDPAWSPDGRRIAFSSGAIYLGAIYLMNPDGTDVRQVTSPASPCEEGCWYEYDSQPAWSPDGATIAFARSNCDGLGIGCAHQTMTINADGTGLREVTPSYGYMGSSEGEPSWAPHGRKIAYVDTGDTEIIKVVRADGSQTVQLVGGSYPAWRR